MRASRAVVGAAWSAAGLALLGALSLWRPPNVSPALHSPPVPALVEVPEPVDEGTLRAAASIIHERNPFRADRSPTDVPFGSEPERDPPEEPDEPEEEAPPQAELTLKGIVGGAPWGVVIEGVPGAERGLLLLLGEERAGVRLEEVRGDTVVVSGALGTWTLTPARAWRR